MRCARHFRLPTCSVTRKPARAGAMHATARWRRGVVSAGCAGASGRRTAWCEGCAAVMAGHASGTRGCRSRRCRRRRAFGGASGVQIGALPELASLGLMPHGKTLQPAGERAANETLRSFLDHRGHGYLKAISSPLSAETGGSRLSPYLAFGMLSMRTAHQATATWMSHSDNAFAKRALRGFSGRLHWHCHFMQKLESQPSMEFRNLARSVDGLREGEFNRSYFEAWCAGQTGYPMVDACMRSLHATGWLNFRMRAMLVSFAAYHLWLHWREPGLFLARQFLDFEPGIHWSQLQMQSGTTGINAMRMYSPTKQAREHDPHGIFIRRWLPELTRVPLPLLAEPWRLTIGQQRVAGCIIGEHYPAPLIEERSALAHAKTRMYDARRVLDARREATVIQEQHGSRRGAVTRSPGNRRGTRGGTTNPNPQGDLFNHDRPTVPADRDAALARLEAVRPADYARTRNALDGAVTQLSPYLSHGVLTLPEAHAADRSAPRHRSETQAGVRVRVARVLPSCVVAPRHGYFPVAARRPAAGRRLRRRTAAGYPARSHRDSGDRPRGGGAVCLRLPAQPCAHVAGQLRGAPAQDPLARGCRLALRAPSRRRPGQQPSRAGNGLPAPPATSRTCSTPTMWPDSHRTSGTARGARSIAATRRWIRWREVPRQPLCRTIAGRRRRCVNRCCWISHLKRWALPHRRPLRSPAATCGCCIPGRYDNPRRTFRRRLGSSPWALPNGMPAVPGQRHAGALSASSRQRWQRTPGLER